MCCCSAVSRPCACRTGVSPAAIPMAPVARCHLRLPVIWRWDMICPEAVKLARGYILQAIAQGADVQTGQGHGPLNHGWGPLATKKLEKIPDASV